MRLINCETLQLEEFFGWRIPRYAILSHTWGDEEVSFADLPLSQPKTKAKAGYRKIEYTCAQATADGFNYAWIDTCCIDKSSSAELSEAINSMFSWYQDSARCYVYLSDVSEANMTETFPESRWFCRGWTLQELLAPEKVIFFDQEWKELGTKSQHADWISKITGIDVPALFGRGPVDMENQDIGLGSFCVARRMSWASRRRTTREEDMAYCLLGIFNVNMPLLYGEGRGAFLRLQEEIIRKVDDDSILAWGLEPEMKHPLGLVPDHVKSGMNNTIYLTPALAWSPEDFKNCGDLNYAAESTSPFTITNVGLQIQLPLVPVYEPNDPANPNGIPGWIGLLSCSTGSSQEFLGILLTAAGPKYDSSARVSRAMCLTDGGAYRTLVVSPRIAVRATLEKTTIIGSDQSQALRWRPLRYLQIVVNQSKALESLGYRVIDGTGLSHREIIYEVDEGEGDQQEREGEKSQQEDEGQGNQQEDKGEWNQQGNEGEGDQQENEVQGNHQENEVEGNQEDNEEQGNQQENEGAPNWDPEKMILTVREDHASLVLLRFEPSSGDTNSKFTTIMRPSSRRAVIREEGPSSEDEELSLFKSLKAKSPQDQDPNVTIRDTDGKIFEVRVEIRSMTIHNRQIFEVNVDAVRVVDGNTSCGDSRMTTDE